MFWSQVRQQQLEELVIVHGIAILMVNFIVELI